MTPTATTVRLYDSAQRRLVNWRPGKDVRIYVCGITPYDSAHMGHILTFLTYDLLQRYLEDQGHSVTMVRNITDVDDPIFHRAAENGEPYMELAARETKSFHSVLQQLNFRPPAHEPKASEYIQEMAAAVSQLVDAGYGYTVDSDIYFDTSRDAAFGSLSGFSDQLQHGLMAGRGGDPERPGKRNPLDFLLWKAVDDPLDPATWNPRARHIPPGRPGWHIECSVMSSELLMTRDMSGDTPGDRTPFDLHGGGNDLVFPHHECEAAQTRALAGTAAGSARDGVLAEHWMHVAALDYCGEKMSKSLGNLVFARDLLAEHEPAAVRLSLMNYHYRIGGEWLPCLVQEAAELLQAVRATYHAGHISDRAARTFGVRVRRAMANDMDTHSIMHLIEDLATSKPAESDTGPATADSLRHTFDLLGLTP